MRIPRAGCAGHTPDTAQDCRARGLEGEALTPVLDVAHDLGVGAQLGVRVEVVVAERPQAQALGIEVHPSVTHNRRSMVPMAEMSALSMDRQVER